LSFTAQPVGAILPVIRRRPMVARADLETEFRAELISPTVD